MLLLIRNNLSYHEIMTFVDRIGLTTKVSRSRVLRFLQQYATKDRTLEIGVGNDAYRTLFPNRISLDREQRPGVHVDVVADAHHLPFQTNEFDCVVCIAVLEHVLNPTQVVKEVHRVLKPGGLFLVSVPFIYPLHDVPSDYWRFTKYGLTQLLQEFDIVECKADTNTMEAIAVLFQRIGFQCDTLWLRPLKLFWFLLAQVFVACARVITKEYGDISHRTTEQGILATGYCVAARKPQLNLAVLS